MKKITTLLSLFSIAFLGYSQTTMKFETHALQANHTHSTQYVENVEAGEGGENQIWNFSDFHCGNLKSSQIDATENLKIDYPAITNIVVSDDENFFFFDVDEFGIDYYGLTTPNSEIFFDEPMAKMRYPFTYGDYEEGTFSGAGLYYGQISTDIYGTYTIEADGYGTLLLPNDVTLNNTLRIKTTHHTTEIAPCDITEFFNTKYLWYSPEHRYPIMVVIETEKINKGESTTSVTGYYNEQALQASTVESNINFANFEVRVYPNPTSEEINISYNLPEKNKVALELYDITGMKVATIQEETEQAGKNAVNYSPNLAVGTYFIKMTVGKETFFSKVVLVD